MAIIQIYQNSKKDIVGDYYNENNLDNPSKKLSTSSIKQILEKLYDVPASIDVSQNDVLAVIYQLNNEKLEIFINERKKLNQEELINNYTKRIKVKSGTIKKSIKKETKPQELNNKQNTHPETEPEILPIMNKKREPINKPLMNNIPEQINKPVINKKKKVERKKVGTKIIAVTLAALTPLLVSNIKKQKEKKVDSIENKKSIKIEQIEEKSETKENNYDAFDYELTEDNSNTKDLELPESSSKIKKMDYKKIVPEYNYEINLDYTDKREDEKYNNVVDNYLPIIHKYSKTYGLDPKIVVAIASQERGFHSSEIDSAGGIGLMQVQYNVWADNDITAYNFERQNYETEHIDGEKLKELDYNIKIGCMIFSHYLEKSDYNLLCAVFGYNKGIYGVLEKAHNKLNNPEDLSWVEDARNVPNGDDYYPENVFGYIEANDIIKITTKEGTEMKYLITNNSRTPIRN